MTTTKCPYYMTIGFHMVITIQHIPCAAGALVCLAFVHNLLRRHPACNVLLNRPRLSSSAANGTVSEHADVFLGEEGDPVKSRAIESSLWEVESLRNHFCPQVGTLKIPRVEG